MLAFLELASPRVASAINQTSTISTTYTDLLTAADWIGALC